MKEEEAAFAPRPDANKSSGQSSGQSGASTSAAVAAKEGGMKDGAGKSEMDGINEEEANQVEGKGGDEKGEGEAVATAMDVEGEVERWHVHRCYCAV